jgi:hypothetical protein
MDFQSVRTEVVGQRQEVEERERTYDAMPAIPRL